MKYILEELTSKNSIDDIKEVAKCMRDIQKFNESDYYLSDLSHMGFHGYSIPDEQAYVTYTENCITDEDCKIYMARETCCSKSVIGVAMGGLTLPEKLTSRSSGRVLFYWINPKYRKTTLGNNLYKKLWGWFDDRNAVSVSITFKSWQKDLAKYFKSKGYEENNVELVGPVRFLEASA